jgi:hypothetical protein
MDLLTQVVAMSQLKTRNDVAVAVTRQSLKMQKSVVDMLDQSTRAMVAANQGTLVDKTA